MGSGGEGRAWWCRQLPPGTPAPHQHPTSTLSAAAPTPHWGTARTLSGAAPQQQRPHKPLGLLLGFPPAMKFWGKALEKGEKRNVAELGQQLHAWLLPGGGARSLPAPGMCPGTRPVPLPVALSPSPTFLPCTLRPPSAQEHPRHRGSFGFLPCLEHENPQKSCFFPKYLRKRRHQALTHVGAQRRGPSTQRCWEGGAGTEILGVRGH